jgi:hypothetical protein
MFSKLYSLCNEQLVTVAAAAAMGWVFSFRKWLTLDLII